MLQKIEPYYEVTLNQQGFMLKKLDPFAHKFLDFLSNNTTGLPALDVGAAYGIVTLEAHRLGYPIIANDLCEDHLRLMQERTQLMGLKPIPTMPGDFFQLSIAPSSLSAIHASRVLHFLHGEDMIKALNLFHSWLVPGGKLFAINETPFMGPIARYLPRYLEKKAVNDPWPGWVDDEDMDIYFSPESRPYVQSHVNYLDEDTCRKCLDQTPFEVEELMYYNRRGYFPDDVLVDGRESIGFIAQKNSSSPTLSVMPG